MRSRMLSTMALVASAALFSADASAQAVTYVNPGSPADASGPPFSSAVMVGNTLYLSGNGGIDAATMTVPEDPKDEAKLLMENFKAVLAEAGMTLDDLVYVTVYCSDLSLYSDFNEVYRTYFSGDFPARAFIGSAPLLFGMRFELQGIAVK